MPSHTFTNPSQPPVANVPYLLKDKKMRTNNTMRYHGAMKSEDQSFYIGWKAIALTG